MTFKADQGIILNSKGAVGRTKKVLLFLSLGLLLTFFAIVSASFGSYKISLKEMLALLASKLPFYTGEAVPKLHEVIIWKLRIPRILMAMAVGAIFSASGTAYQACFHNPLAEPYLLGVSAGAAFGAALGIVYPSVFASVQFSAFAFALLAVFLSWSIAQSRGHIPSASLVIAGIVISSLFNAFVSSLKYIAPDAQLREITFWMMGGFYYAGWKDAALLFPMAMLIVIGFYLLSWKMNILAMGDEEARSLGVDPVIYRLVFIGLSTLATAFAVSASGIIPWLGLMAPHAARMLFGSDNSYVLPGGAILGAGFMLLCDTIARSMTGSEIPIGIVISILGAPFLIYLLRSRGKAIYQ